MRTLYLLWIGLGVLGAWLAPASGALAQCGAVTPVISSVARNPVDAARVYSLAALVEGDHYFSDRNNPGSHILVAIPAPFQCAQWVKTPNDDKEQASTDLVQLQLAQASVVHIGFDNRAASPPTWLTTTLAFEDTGLSIDIAETGTQTAFRVWKRAFPAGPVVLGGNSAPGSSFPSGKSNYVIFALPDLPDPDDLDGDGVDNDADNCPSVANPGQEDSELAARGLPFGIFEADPDGVGDACDNCPGPVLTGSDPDRGRDHNTAQRDLDGDGVGDTCDNDVDGDGVLDELDNCLYTPNPGQEPGAGASGGACELPGLPYEAHGLDVTQVHHFAIEMDALPPRAEVRIELLPAERNLDLEVDVECSGDPLLQGTCSSVVPRWDCDRFPRPVAFKVVGNGVVQPIHLQPESIDDPSQPQPADGEWVVPFFLYMQSEAFSQLPDLDLVCFVEIHPLPGSTATGTFGVRLAPRTKPPAAQLQDPNPPQNLIFLDEVGEYGFFTPLGTNFTLLNSGDLTLGQCVIDDPETGGGRHVAVPGARGWNCCTFTYETVETSFPHEGSFESQLGHAAIFVGSLPPDAQPDLDGDLILDFCDNCPLRINSTQDDADGDGIGDSCDNCPAVPNATQANTDGLLAGDACQCADVDADDATDVADVAMMRRYLAGRANAASFSSTLCVLAPGSFPCDPLGVLQLRRVLAGASPPLVQNCP
jgi:hypothetical protein